MLKKLIYYLLFLTASSITSTRLQPLAAEDISDNTAATPSSEEKSLPPTLPPEQEDKEKKQARQNTSKPNTPKQTFKPSEEISEDFSVPFPTDI